MDKRADLAMAVAVISLGIAAFAVAGGISAGSVRDPIGTSGVPRALALLIVACGIALAVRRVRTWGRDPGWTVPAEGAVDEPDHPASGSRAMAMAGLGFAYALLLEPVGFPLLTPLLLASGLLLMGERSWRRIAAYAVGLTAVVHVVFVFVFGVLLPLGPLMPWDYYLWFQL